MSEKTNDDLIFKPNYTAKITELSDKLNKIKKQILLEDGKYDLIRYSFDTATDSHSKDKLSKDLTAQVNKIKKMNSIAKEINEQIYNLRSEEKNSF